MANKEAVICTLLFILSGSEGTKSLLQPLLILVGSKQYFQFPQNITYI